MGSKTQLIPGHVEGATHELLAPASVEQADALQALLGQRAVRLAPQVLPEVVIGELIALTDNGETPLVRYAGQPGVNALRARSVVDLHGAHIGKSVTLAFENSDASLPIVMGVLRKGSQPLEAPAGQVQLEADGTRMIVSAKGQLVLRCGEASITLTEAGKVVISGSHVVSHATGMNRIKGGSVQVN